jgi:glycerophosphoryl diester phosphodiesterase
VGRYFELSTPLGIAHRGGSLERLENSPEAFQNALNLGYRVMETDVHATRDGVLVVHHDPDTQRTALEKVDIQNTTWTELSNIRLKNGEAILSLNELIEFVGPNVFLNIDPKSDDSVPLLMTLLSDSPELVSRVCIGSFSTKRIQALRDNVRGLNSSLGSSELRRLVLAFVSRRSASSIKAWLPKAVAAQIPVSAFGIRFANETFISFLQDLGLDVHFWTIDEEAEMRRIYALGADAVMTDRPSVLKQVLADLSER